VSKGVRLTLLVGRLTQLDQLCVLFDPTREFRERGCASQIDFFFFRIQNFRIFGGA